MENESKNTPMVFDQLLTENLLMRESFPESYPTRRRRGDKFKCEEAIRSATLGKRARCQTELESSITDYACTKRQGFIMTAKHAVTEQSSDINRLIIEKLKKVVNNNDRTKKQDKQLKLEDFGLNITQIKRLDLPPKRETLKDRLSSNKAIIIDHCQPNLPNKKRIHTKKSLVKDKMEGRDTLPNSEER